MLQLCEGTIMDLVRGMIATNRRMQEEHIAFILREVVKVILRYYKVSIHCYFHVDAPGGAFQGIYY